MALFASYLGILAGRRHEGPASELPFSYTQQDDANFKMVDSTKPSRPQHGRRRMVQNPKLLRRDVHAGGNRRDRDNRGGGGPGKNRHQRRRNMWEERNRRANIGASVEVRADWNVIKNGQMQFSQIAKLSGREPAAKTLKECGSVGTFIEEYDRVNVRTAKPLTTSVDRTIFNVTASDDPVLQGYAADGTGNVLVTDDVLAAIMCIARSVYSWDIVFNKRDGKVFVDKRPNTRLDYLTTNECAQDPPQHEDPKHINSMHKIAQESTATYQAMSQQIVDHSQKKTFGDGNPFVEGGSEDNVASIAYRYRLFELGSLKMVVRSEVHGVLPRKGDDADRFFFSAGVTECIVDPMFSWRKKLAAQRGAVLANELKNNSNKLARWAVRANLADVDQVVFGLVGRKAPRDNKRHEICSVLQYRPTDFAKQINLHMTNAWAVFTTLVELCMAQPDGRYVLMKDTEKPLIRMYSVPVDSDLGTDPMPEVVQASVFDE